MTDNDNRPGGTKVEAKEVNIGGDVVGRDMHVYKEDDKSPSMGVMGVIGVVGLILIGVLVLAFIFGPRVLNFGQAPGPQTAEANPATAALLISTPPVMGTPTLKREVLPIEEVPFKVFAYGGVNEPNGGQGSGTLTLVRNGITSTEYYLDYYLPDEGDGYAGLAFRFLDSQDWTPYKFIEVTISFEDKEASCDFGVRDIAGEVGYVRLGGSEPASDIALTISGKQQTAKIPLATNFKSVNQKVVYELIFNTDSYFTRGRHMFKISSIKLLKS